MVLGLFQVPKIGIVSLSESRLTIFRSVQFWETRTGATQLILQGHRNSGSLFFSLCDLNRSVVISVALAGGEDSLSGKFATGSGDFKCRVWNYKTLVGVEWKQNVFVIKFIQFLCLV